MVQVLGRLVLVSSLLLNLVLCGLVVSMGEVLKAKAELKAIEDDTIRLRWKIYRRSGVVVPVKVGNISMWQTFDAPEVIAPIKE
jgi:hypothetical protein